MYIFVIIQLFVRIFFHLIFNEMVNAKDLLRIKMKKKIQKIVKVINPLFHLRKVFII